MTRYLILAIMFAAILFVVSYKSSLALFAASAQSTGNTFATASGFPTGATTTPSETPTTTPTDEQPTAGKIVINEVFEASSSAEWIELYNSGGTAVNVSGWRITDQNDVNSASEDILPPTPLIQPGAFAVIVTQSSTAGSIPGSAITITLTNGTIGSGLNGSSENVYLKSDATTIVDQMGYGTTNIFGGNLPASALTGQTLRRIPNGTDTDTTVDWQNGTPSIGVTN